MRTLIVSETQSNKKIDRVIRDSFPKMPSSALFKAFRKRDVKVNGTRVKDDYIVKAGDTLEIYIIDEILDGKPNEEDTKLNKGFTVAYEDRNIIIVNKEQGIPVHPDREQSTGTLIDMVRLYLTEKGEYIPGFPGSFPPALCHRLDRNTGGLVIVAKDTESLDILLDKIKNKEIKKYYQCLVIGKMEKDAAEIRAFLTKDERKSRVFISDTKVKDSLEIVTRYKVLSFKDNLSKLEVELITGRTHQIRAHMAHIGHPIAGDGKYGLNSYNRPLGLKRQALWAYKLVFDITDAGKLSYLKGRKFEVTPEFEIKI